MTLTFKAEGHRYYWNNQEMPSVTTVLSKLRVTPPYPKTANSLRAANRGTAIHAMTARDDAGLDAGEDLDTVGYLNAWREFRAAYGQTVEACEHKVCSHQYGYAGTIDRVFCDPTSRTYTIVDLKTGSASKWHRLQTAAYALAYGEHLNPAAPQQPIKRMAVYITGEGKFKIRAHDDTRDFVAWKAAITLYHWTRS